MKATVYINRHIVAANKKHNANNPAISINTYKGVEYCHKIAFSNAVLIQDMETPRCSGANIWIECDRSDITIIS